jgi:hypothetical protein
MKMKALLKGGILIAVFIWTLASNQVHEVAAINYSLRSEITVGDIV